MPKTPALPIGKPVSIEDAIWRIAAKFKQSDLTYAHGVQTAQDEASWLLLDTLGLSPLVAPDYEQTLSREQVEKTNLIVNQRIENRLPAAYLTGRTWFAGHELLCDARALIPRSPLAECITADFFGLLPDNPQMRLLDLCTGGGCIAIACAYEWPNAQVIASDLSAEALSLAAENIALHELEQRIKLVRGSLFDAVDGAFDLIVSNPPYVDAAEIAALSAEFLHEPLMGLAAGLDGLDLVRRILFHAASYLSEDGLLVVEVGNSELALQRLYPDVPFLWLEFANGGSGVFALTRDELVTYSDTFATMLSVAPVKN